MLRKSWQTIRVHVTLPIIFTFAVAVVLNALPYTGWQPSHFAAQFLVYSGIAVGGLCLVLITRNEILLRGKTRTATENRQLGNVVAVVKEQTEDIAIKADKIIVQLEAAYDRCGDEAIAYPLGDYERNYLVKHAEWETIQKEFPSNRPAAIITGLATCYKQILRLYGNELSFVGIPLLLEAETDKEIRKLKSDLTEIDVRFGDSILHRELEKIRIFLKIKESYRVIHRLSLKHAISSTELCQLYLNKVDISEKNLSEGRAEIQKCIKRLQGKG